MGPSPGDAVSEKNAGGTGLGGTGEWGRGHVDITLFHSCPCLVFLAGPVLLAVVKAAVLAPPPPAGPSVNNAHPFHVQNSPLHEGRGVHLAKGGSVLPWLDFRRPLLVLNLCKEPATLKKADKSLLVSQIHHNGKKIHFTMYQVRTQAVRANHDTCPLCPQREDRAAGTAISSDPHDTSSRSLWLPVRRGGKRRPQRCLSVKLLRTKREAAKPRRPSDVLFLPEKKVHSGTNSDSTLGSHPTPEVLQLLGPSPFLSCTAGPCLHAAGGTGEARLPCEREQVTPELGAAVPGAASASLSRMCLQHGRTFQRKTSRSQVLAKDKRKRAPSLIRLALTLLLRFIKKRLAAEQSTHGSETNGDQANPSGRAGEPAAEAAGPEGHGPAGREAPESPGGAEGRRPPDTRQSAQR
ncbi:hypothetical protein CB1_000273020 [Camelus ferus]|nr:hypothetical protein CB1_000273020 [Camelus ferus]